ncbi:MAG: FAD-dependent oxidoreductase [Verrucomicrobiota bacterium]
MAVPAAVFTRLVPEGGHWRVETAAGTAIRAGAVVLTPPVPQALALLEAGVPPLPPEWRARLAGLGYERCLAVLALLEGPSCLPDPGALAPADGPIAWLADNQRKGVSAEPAVTLHATPAFSLAHWEQDRGESARHLLDAAAPWLGTGVRSFQVHGWRFSRPWRADPAPCLALAARPALVLAGDAWGGSGAEGAARSGWAAARALLEEKSPADPLPRA